ncbi:hypothetical protein HK102_005856 [Quaeritorhiza haematococci]|nr:hypothetical protein HK102_005856 [Quaeritorhiza haematococci]
MAQVFRDVQTCGVGGVTQKEEEECRGRNEVCENGGGVEGMVRGDQLGEKCEKSRECEVWRSGDGIEEGGEGEGVRLKGDMKRKRREEEGEVEDEGEGEERKVGCVEVSKHS